MSELGMPALLLKPMATHPLGLVVDIVTSRLLPFTAHIAENSLLLKHVLEVSPAFGKGAGVDVGGAGPTA